MSLSGPAERFSGGRTTGLVEAMRRVGEAFGAGSPTPRAGQNID
jgi:hypothetical protein